MNAQLEILCKSLLKPMVGGQFALEEGSTIADLMERSIARDGSPDPRALNFVLYLLDGKSAQAEDRLVPDATVTVVRMVFGG